MNKCWWRMGGDDERPDYNAWAHTILLDPRARAFVSGAGYKWAGT